MNSISNLSGRGIFVVAMLALVFVIGCNEKQLLHQTQIFDEFSGQFAGPTAVEVSSDGNYFYVLNSDFDRQYNTGSITIVSSAGVKTDYIRTPRLGNAMRVVDKDLFALYDRTGNDTSALVEYYDLTNPVAPSLVKQWQIDCSPLNIAVRKGYPYFFVSCIGGGLYVGDKSWDQLKLIRNYGPIDRRAMYLDTERQLLFLFPTNLGKQVAQDILTNDVSSYSDEGVATSLPNEIPDQFENTKAIRRNYAVRSGFQFVVYDIAQEQAAGFPNRVQHSETDPTADAELRWLYFVLNNFDGTPDVDDGLRFVGNKYYRTNIWEARPDATDSSAFFFSHRGLIDANDIVKAHITDNPRVVASTGGTCAANQRLVGNLCVPFTSNFLRFDRVYGFNGEIDSLHYAGDFTISRVNGVDVILINHFRDLVYWTKANQRFSLVAKALNAQSWESEIFSTTAKRSYYQVAMNEQGTALTCSYYGASVILLKVTPGTGIQEQLLLE